MDAGKFQRQLLSSLESHGISKNERVLVAFSGGVDSTALLHAMNVLWKNSSGKLFAAHLDHAIRGRESELGLRNAERFCERWSIELFTDRLDESRLRARSSGLGSMEAALREERYIFFEKAALSIGAKWILIGHHRDDQAETVLFRSLREMNWRALSGMPGRRGAYVRPLLEITREETTSYCKTLGLVINEDSSNLDIRIMRNRLRHHVLPLFRDSFNKNVDSLLVKLAELTRRLADIEEILLEQFSALWMENKPGTAFDLAQVRAIPEVLMEGAVLKIIGVDTAGYQSGQLVNDLKKMILEQKQGDLYLRGGDILRLEGSGLIRLHVNDVASVEVVEQIWEEIPGKIILPALKVLLTAEERLYDGKTPLAGGKSVMISLEKLKVPLKVRTRRQGDRFMPLGMNKSKKLKKFLLDRKVPKHLRDRIPLVVDFEGDIIWIGGIEISQKVSLKMGSQQRAYELSIVSTDNSG